MIKNLLAFSACTILALSITSPVVLASDEEHFREAVEHAIGPIVREEVDQAIDETESLVKQAVEIVEEAAHGFHDKEKILLDSTLAGVGSMLSQSPEELEEAWLHGEAFHDQGIELDDFDHFSKVMAYYDMLIHPAMAHSLLKAFKTNGEHHMLEQAREELAELLEHEGEQGEEEGHGSDH